MRCRGQLPELPAVPRCSDSLVGADDMSNINPISAVQFVIAYASRGCALHLRCGSSTWSLVCSTATPTVSDPEIGVTQLSGVWLSAQTRMRSAPGHDAAQVVPWRFVAGVERAAHGTASPRST